MRTVVVSDRAIALAVGAVAAAAYVAFGWGASTVHDYHGRLAEAFLHGRYWLTVAPPWLNELLECGPGRFCVVYPPLPAALAVALVPFVGTVMAQGLVAQIAGGASAGVLYLGLRAYGAPRFVALAGAAVSAFGTTLLFSSVDGRAWYAAHSVAVLFGSVAFWLAARGGPPVALGAAIGLAALARLPVAAAMPALALLAARRGGLPFPRVLALVIAGGLPFAALYLGYDILRWGGLLDSGYARLTEGDIFFSQGLLSPLYLPRHLYAIFLEPPDIVEGTAWFLRPRFIGMSLFLTTPAFLWIFAGLRQMRSDAAVAAMALAAGLALLPNVLHGTVGFQQFGYRFSLDAQPFLVALALVGDARVGGVWRRRPSVLFLVAAALAVAVNVYATIAIVRYGYWQ
ncbi:MAG: hypothetical protein AABZ26_07635 [Chloroflexota bacterium]